MTERPIEQATAAPGERRELFKKPGPCPYCGSENTYTEMIQRGYAPGPKGFRDLIPGFNRCQDCGA